MDLRNKTVIVTGASAGIGEATARELARAGARLMLTARRADKLQALADSLSAAAFPADIADPAVPGELLDFALERFGRADVIVNNAAMLLAPTIDTADLEKLSYMTRVNFESMVRSSYIFAKHFKAQGSGAIINVSSIGAHVLPAKFGLYAGLKGAMETFTNSLRVELSGTGVKVGTIAPGSVATDIFDGIKPDDSWKKDALLPEDIARAIRFMLEQPDRANVVSMLLYSSREIV